MSKPDGTRKHVSRRDFVRNTAAAIGATSLAGIGADSVNAAKPPRHWDQSADVVIIGSGASGLPASIEAAEHGASVIVIEQNYDVGGHGIQSGGNIALGGGTSLQKKYGIEDSPDRMFEDLANWPDYRFSDREIVRAFCDESPATFEFLVAHGVVFPDRSPIGVDGGPQNVSARKSRCGRARSTNMPRTAAMERPSMRPWRPRQKTGRANSAGAHHHRPDSRGEFSGRVLGVTATTQGKPAHPGEEHGVILGTGGHSSNVNFRRIFDPRLTEEYQVVGEPYSRQTGDGRSCRACKWGRLCGAVANQTVETKARSHIFEKPYVIGNQYGYPHGGGARPENLRDSPDPGLARAIGLQVPDYQNLIQVNHGRQTIRERNGYRFRLVESVPGGKAGKSEGGGPIWAIFDADGAQREKWTCGPPYVDPDGWFFTADTLAELAAKIVSKYQKEPISGAVLQETVARYNSFVEKGKDEDFGKPAPRYKIQTAPFYAAWSTPCVHDCTSGLRINGKAQVIDMKGEVIPGLYCAGESAGGFNQHGLARSLTFGRIAGREAARSVAKT